MYHRHGSFLMVPHESLGQGGNWIIGAACTLAFGAIVFTMRAVFFAPMDEVRVPKEITGAAMSLHPWSSTFPMHLHM